MWVWGTWAGAGPQSCRADNRGARRWRGSCCRTGRWLLDEPFAALDPGLRTEMVRLLTALWQERGLTYVMATHDLRDAERSCDRIWLLQEGRVVLDRPVEGLRDDPPDALRDWF
ncbi:MAG: ABC-type thiamine uptake system ATPase component ThiQ [Rhodobacteraceae bacterium HLUCCO18]|nr:MAG: ABC-type thiamine uptake system ATPase component ThiQ [Rhodobacteraceae bacterium HLUCCO18]